MAMLLGDSGEMEKEQRELYRDSGIAHLLAVSGQHLSVIGGGVYLILRKLGFGFTGAGAVGALFGPELWPSHRRLRLCHACCDHDPLSVAG
mgnify:CR=1 FL=1